MFRTIDANLNRICEGLRVIEDFLRFEHNDIEVIPELKKMRHFLRKEIGEKLRVKLLQERSSVDDTGKENTKEENDRSSYLDIMKANFKRIEEGLRVLEEFFKLDSDLIKYVIQIKAFRFNIYDIEKKVILLIEK